MMLFYTPPCCYWRCTCLTSDNLNWGASSLPSSKGRPLIIYSLFYLLKAYDTIILEYLALASFSKAWTISALVIQDWGLEEQNNWILEKNKIASSFGGLRDFGKRKFGQRNGGGTITQEDEVNLLWRKGLFQKKRRNRSVYAELRVCALLWLITRTAAKFPSWK